MTLAKVPVTNTPRSVTPATTATLRNQTGSERTSPSDTTPPESKIEATRAASFHLSYPWAALRTADGPSCKTVGAIVRPRATARATAPRTPSPTATR